MITREEYNKALDTIEAYQEQFLTTIRDVRQKEDMPSSEDAIQIKSASKNKFLDWFNNKRTELIGKPSNFNTFSNEDKLNLSELRKSYSLENFEMAMMAFCSDEFYLSKNLILPNHFLDNNKFIKFLHSYEKPKTKTLKETLRP